jgi:hypothetical protein
MYYAFPPAVVVWAFSLDMLLHLPFDAALLLFTIHFALHTPRTAAGAPVDLDEQCGVIIDKTGTDKTGICSRSLTCKTHGVGAKRSVPGRSKPFDTLLIEFQKRKEIRLASKAAREKEKEKQQAKIAMATPGGVAASTSSNANSNIIAASGAGGGTGGNNASNVADISVGDDIAVPQAGPSTSMILQSPSPMNSIAFTQHQGNDDIQVYQNLLQPSQQPPSRPPSGSIAVQSQATVATSGSQSGNHQDVPSAPSQANTASANAQTSTSGVKQKPSQITLNAGSGGNNNTSPAKSTTANASGTTLTTTKKKRAADGVKTSKSKASTRNKADLILGEVDDPPEPVNAVSATLVGADGNLIVEEEAPDSDDEVDQLLLAMTQSRPRPLAMPTFAPYERTPMKLAKYRESFLTAFTGRSMSSSAS